MMIFFSRFLSLALFCFLSGYGEEGPTSSKSTTTSVSAAEERAWIPHYGMSETLPHGTPSSIQPLPVSKGRRPVSPLSVELFENAKYREFVDAFASFEARSKKIPLSESRVLASQIFTPLHAEPVRQIENIEISGRDLHAVPVRIYIPKGTTALPVIVYFHPGGWAFGSIEEADPICRKMANIFESIVVSVDYRLAPEAPFPCAIEDCYAATLWVSDNIDSFGGDHTNIIVCGEGAGGNLAAGVSLLARDKQHPQIRSQLLICPPLNAVLTAAPYDECLDRHFLTHEVMSWLWRMYLRFPGDAGNSYASPILVSDCKRVAPAVVITAEYDPLHKEAEGYAQRLRRAGVCVVSKRFSGVIHGFLSLPLYEEEQKNAWLQEIKMMIKKLDGLTEE